MFKLLADLMMFLLKAPVAFLKVFNEYIVQRMQTQKAFSAAKGEAKAVSKVARFFSFLGLVFVLLLVAALFVGVLVFLWYLNEQLSLERVLGGPFPIARPYWLPLLMVLFLISCFVGYQLYRSLGPDRLVVEFDDLEDAWLQAKSALVESGIDLTSVPLFLVLGRTASSLHALLSAARLAFIVEQVPLKANAPLQVYANKQAIYVVVPDACLLGRQAELLFEAAEEPEPQASKSVVPSVFEEPPESVRPAPAVLQAPPPAIDPLLATQNLLAEPSSSGGVGLLTAPAEPATMPWEVEGHRRMPALLKRTQEVARYQRRLGYVARRITRDRAPYCPLNGVLLLVPFESLEHDEDASQMASLCQADLQVLHDTTHLSCPVIVLMTDLERARGYDALSEYLDADRKVRLFGQDLPLLPDVKAEEMPRVLSGSVQHFGDAVSHWFFRLFRVEKSERDQAAESTKGNTQLFELLGAICQRQNALERILMRILLSEPSLEFTVGGYYLAATGVNPEREQAFVPGVFQQMVQNQNAVTWTQDALTEEADYQRWSTYGYAALAIFIIAVVMIIYGRWQMLRW